MPCLPNDVILYEILPRLSASDVFRFKFVSKFWWDAISDPNFIKAHLASPTRRTGSINVIWNSILQYHDWRELIEINLSHMFPYSLYLLPMTSCNGLVVVGSPQDSEYCIINPATRQCMKLPQPSLPITHCFLHFDHVLNRYKLFGWDTCRDTPVFMFVFNAGKTSTSTWLEFNPPPDLSIWWIPPVVYNRWFYWMAHKAGSAAILALNTETGDLREIKIPTSSDPIWEFKLAATNGCLYLLIVHCYYMFTERNCHIVWSLENLDEQEWHKVYQNRREDCHLCTENRFSDDWSGLSVVEEITKNIASTEDFVDEHDNIDCVNSLVWFDNK